jgi:hypothetical protein
MKKILLSLILVALLCPIAHADDPKPQEGDFVSNTLRMMFDKVGQYTTGEKKLIPMSDDSWRTGDTKKLDRQEEKLDNITIRGMTTTTKASTDKPANQTNP